MVKNIVYKFIEVIFKIFLLIGAFISLDLLYHYFYEKNFSIFVVPASYFVNEIFWSIPLGILAYYFVNKMLKLKDYSYKKTLFFALIVIIPFQLKYWNTGYFKPSQSIVIIVANYIMITTLLWLYYKIYDVDYLR